MRRRWSRRRATLTPIASGAMGAGDGRCLLFEESISAAIDGEAPPLSAREVQEHLGGCVGCRQFAERARQLGEHLTPHAPAEIALVAGSPSAASTSARSHGYRRLLPLGAAMVLLIGLGFAALGAGAFAEAPKPPAAPATPCTAHLSHHGIDGDLLRVGERRS